MPHRNHGQHVRHEVCGACGGEVVRVAPAGMPLGFGQVAFRHVGGQGCPGGPGAQRLIALITRAGRSPRSDPGRRG